MQIFSIKIIIIPKTPEKTDQQQQTKHFSFLIISGNNFITDYKYYFFNWTNFVDLNFTTDWNKLWGKFRNASIFIYKIAANYRRLLLLNLEMSEMSLVDWVCLWFLLVFNVLSWVWCTWLWMKLCAMFYIL